MNRRKGQDIKEPHVIVKLSAASRGWVYRGSTCDDLESMTTEGFYVVRIDDGMLCTAKAHKSTQVKANSVALSPIKFCPYCGEPVVTMGIDAWQTYQALRDLAEKFNSDNLRDEVIAKIAELRGEWE